MKQNVLTFLILCGIVFPAFSQDISVSDNTEQCVINSGDLVTFTFNVSPANATDVVTNGSVAMVFDFYHSWASDVEIILCGPGGSPCATLKTDGANSSNDYGTADGSTYGSPAAYTISDAGSGDLDDTGDQLPGTYAPVDAFSVFDGIVANGNWTLTLADDANGDDGCIQNATLQMDVESPPTCFKPTVLTATSIAGTTASLSWTTGGASAWEIVVQDAGSGTPVGSGVVASNPYNATSLNSNYNYEFYVRDDCGGGDYSDWAGPFSFTTLPDYCGGDHFYDTGGSASSYQNNENYSTTFCPDTPGDVVTIEFLVVDLETCCDDLGVYNGTGTGSALDDDVIAPATFISTAGDGCITVAFTSDFSTTGDGWDATISCAPPATCPQPTVLSASSITATSASLAWTTGGASNWEIVVQDEGLGTPAGAGTTIGANPYAAMSLMSNHDYEFYVRDDCGGDYSDWSGPFTFSTLIANDDCTGAESLTVGASGDCPTNQVTGDATNATESADELVSCDGFGNLGVWYEFTGPALGALVINYTVGTATGTPGYAIFDACGGTEVFCLNNTATTPVNVTGLTGGQNYKLLIFFDSNPGTFDICLEEAPCEIPTALSVANETQTGADLAWTENGGSDTWDIYIVASGGAAPMSGTTPTIDNTTDNAYTWTGGTASTDYDWYVRADCAAAGGSGQSDWSSSSSFTTLSDDAVDYCNLQFPGSETIDVGNNVTVYAQVYEPGVTEAAGAGAGITAWIGYSDTDSDPSTWSDWTAATFNVQAGNNDEFSADIGASLAPGTYYYASRFQLNSGAFQYGGYTAAGGGFWDGVTNVSGVLTVNPIANDECTGAIALTVTTDGTCSSQLLGTNVNATASGETPTPSCSSFGSGEDVWYSVVVPSTGDVTIEMKPETGGPTDWAMHVLEGSCGGLTEVECDDDDGDGNFPLITLTGRTPGEVLLVRVFEYSNDATGEFNICAHTELCPSPSGLEAQAGTETASGVDVRWTKNGSETTWDLFFTDNGTVPNGATAPTVNDLTATSDDPFTNPYTWTGGMAGTIYEVYVRADCGADNTNVSAWVGSDIFSTLPGCGSSWTDSGGAGGNYTQDETITICPDVGGEVVHVTFTAFSTENNGSSNCYDGMTIYNGNSTAATTIPSPGGSIDEWCWDRNDATPSGTGDLQGLTIVSTDATGCLTFEFDEDGSVDRDGWEATISCSAPTCPPMTIVEQAEGEVSSDAVCVTGDGWHHYYNAGSGDVLLSLELGNTGAQVPLTAVSVNAFGTGAINLGTNIANGGCEAPYTNAPDWFVMKRTWDVSPDVQPSSPVGVRFYYNNQDFLDINAQLGADIVTHTDLTHYKINNGDEEDLTVSGNECHDNVAPANYQEFDPTEYAHSVLMGTAHFAEYDVTSFSGGGGGGGTGALGALPVVLLDFSGYAEKADNHLSWVTASEENAKMFIVERSVNGTDAWVNIGEVSAFGYSNDRQQYDLLDTKTIEVAYYRLKMIDFDGSFEYSNIIYIKRPIEGGVSVYPVPSRGLINVSFSSSQTTSADVVINDLSGRAVYTQQINAVKGLQTEQLDLQHLSNGVYILSLTIDGQRQIKRLVKN